MSDSTAPQTSEVPELPPHLAQRFEEERERYHVSAEQRAKEAQEVEQRHEDLLAIKQGQAHDEVQHAKEVAAAHKASSAEEGTSNLVQQVEDKIASVTAIKAQLGDVDLALAQAEAKERELLERLGGAKV